MRVRSSSGTPAGLLLRPASAELANSSLAGILARRARGCAELSLHSQLHTPEGAPARASDDPLTEWGLWHLMMRACASARTLHVRIGSLDFSKRVEMSEHRDTNAYVNVLEE